MNEIPRQTVWVVIGKNSEGHHKVYESFKALSEAQTRADDLRKEADDLTVEIEETERIIPDRTLPTNKQQKKLGKVMHHVLITIRSLAYNKEPELIAELADVFHNLPTAMFDEECWDWNYLEHSLQKFQEKFPKATLFNFAEMINEIRNEV